MSSSAYRRSDGDRESLDSLTRYLQEIRRYPLLTREQEIALGRRIRAGDTEAMQELICSNLRFVISIAKKYQHQGVALADLINEGNVGLMRAAMRFDESRGVKFISYAVWWVRQAIVQALSEFSSPVRIPANRFGTAPIARGYLSLDTNGRPSDDGKLLDILPDESSPAPDEEVTTNSLSATIDEALSRLSPREALVIRRYFGFDGREGITLEEIGVELGVTRERVRQIKERALLRLRKDAAGAVLLSGARS
jgi:RNA polymerase primary sigma factor